MPALPWPYLAFLSIGYCLALVYGTLAWTAAISIALLLLAGYAVRQQQLPIGRFLGHALSSSWPSPWRCTGCRAFSTGGQSRPIA
jgi:hypothetical protein